MKSIAEIFRSYAVFDSQGRHINGTDKMSNHNYGDAYESLFTHGSIHEVGSLSFRNLIKLVMEVGVADGSCLLAWREIFPNAIIVGMDIHHSDKAHGDNIEFYLGDQRKREDCEYVTKGRLFDLIIDDATHTLENTLFTLFWLWPSVRPGGLYVVEEWPDIHSLHHNIKSLFPVAEIINTYGPFGGIEPLVAFRKPI